MAPNPLFPALRAAEFLASAGSSGVRMPDLIFGPKAKEFWNAGLGYGLTAGTEVASWAGQIRGIALTPPLTTNRPTWNAADANFANHPTIAGSIAGSNFLTATGISPALMTAPCNPCILLVGRSSAAWVSGTECFFGIGGATVTSLGLIYASNGTQQQGRIRMAAGGDSEIPVTVNITTPALTRREHQSGANGGKHYHNTTLAQTSPAAAGLTENANRVGFNCTAAGTLPGNFVAAEIVLLDSIPSAVEWNEYKGSVLARMGVAA